MQIDPELLTATLGVATSLIGTCVGYGIMREKMRRMEKDFDELQEECRKDQDKFVTHQRLNDVVDPLRRTLDIVQKDVKEILRVVGSSHRTKS